MRIQNTACLINSVHFIRVMEPNKAFGEFSYNKRNLLLKYHWYKIIFTSNGAVIK